MEVPVDDAEAEADAALVVYVVVCAEPSTVTVAVTVTTLRDPVAVEVEVVFPTALFLNWSKLFPGLIAKTIPCWQWFACLQ